MYRNLNIVLKKVAIVSPEFGGYRFGGLGIHVSCLVRFLESRGVSVDVYLIKTYAREVWEEPTDSSRIFTITPRESINELPLNGSCMIDPTSPNHFYEQIPQTISTTHYDLVHVHDWYGVLLALYFQSRGIPFLMTCHLPTLANFTYATDKPSRLVQYKIEYLGFRNAQRIIAVSDFIKREIVNKYGIRETKIEVIHNGVDVCSLTKALTKNNNKVSSFKEPIILSISRLNEQKGVDYLIDLAYQLKQDNISFKLIIIGDGELKEYLKERCKVLKIEDRVLLKGFLKQETAWQYLSHANVFVSCSCYEPFGMTLLEAAVAGKPIVCFNTGGINETLKNYPKVTYIRSGDTNGLLKAVKKSLQQRGKDNSTIKRDDCNEFVTFDWKYRFVKLVKVYEKVMASRGRNK
jgi:glycosyltransferase involved in cell wall biosynthesis